MKEIFEIRSCVANLANDIKIYTTEQYIIGLHVYSTVNKELQGIQYILVDLCRLRTAYTFYYYNCLIVLPVISKLS